MSLGFLFFFLLFVSFGINVVLSFLLKRAAKRLLEFDDLFDMFVEDIRVNVDYFEKLRTTPLLSDVAEVKSAHQNMQIIRQRLDEYSMRMREAAGRSGGEGEKLEGGL